MGKKSAKKTSTYFDVCDKCNREFSFKENDVVDKLVKCPHCGYEMIFIKSNYKINNK